MTKRQIAIRRIQKLQALADSERGNGNEIAAESAARIAAKLMVEHAIASLELSAETEEPLITRHVSTGRRLNWLRTLYYVVAEANNCMLSYLPNTDSVTFYGTESDIEISEYLAVHLAREVQAAADAHMREKVEMWGRAPRGCRNNFCQTATMTLGQRLRAMRREAAKEATSEHGEATVTHALVRLDQGLQRAKDFAVSHGLGKARSSRWSYSSEGAAAGKSININKGVRGATTRGSLEG